MPTAVKLIELLRESVGDSVATTAVEQAAADLGLSGELTRDQALEVLEKITETPGLVGVTARFAKSRVHMSWDN